MKATIKIATTADIPQLIILVNSAYRGPDSRKGWTHEADLIEGTLRTDEITLQELISNPDTVILTYRNGEDFNKQIQGCTYLRRHENMMHLGMLAVSPDVQAGGIGRQLLQAAEHYARKENCATIQITVISVRHELLAWYERRGYRKTGATQPFEEEEKFGTPRQDIEFLVLEKKLDN